MYFVIGAIGAIFMLFGATLFWQVKQRAVAGGSIVVGAALMAWSNWKWMLIFLVLSAIIFIFQWFAYLKRSFDRKLLIKRKEELQAPSGAKLLHYQGGNPGLAAGTVLAWVDATGLVLVGLKTGKRIIIAKDHILGIDLHSDVQTVTTGGGRSISGALVGEAVAGPVGAIVGGRKRSRTKTVDRSTVHVRVNSAGIETALIFKGGQTTYNLITGLLGLI